MLCLSVTVKVFSVPDRASLLSDAFALARLVNVSACNSVLVGSWMVLTYTLYDEQLACWRSIAFNGCMLPCFILL